MVHLFICYSECHRVAGWIEAMINVMVQQKILLKVKVKHFFPCCCAGRAYIKPRAQSSLCATCCLCCNQRTNVITSGSYDEHTMSHVALCVWTGLCYICIIKKRIKTQDSPLSNAVYFSSVFRTVWHEVSMYCSSISQIHHFRVWKWLLLNMDLFHNIC